MPGNSTRYVLPDWIENLSFEHALKLLLYGAFGSTAPTGTGVPTTGGGGGSTPVSQTVAGSSAVASGSTSSGIANVTFVASSDFAGTVAGQPLAAGASLTFRASQSNTIGAIAYTRSAGTLYIYTLT